jgi:hypothetical protein
VLTVGNIPLQGPRSEVVDNPLSLPHTDQISSTLGSIGDHYVSKHLLALGVYGNTSAVSDMTSMQPTLLNKESTEILMVHGMRETGVPVFNLGMPRRERHVHQFLYAKRCGLP